MLSTAGFDQVAWAYDTLAKLVFGRGLQQAQVRFLTKIPADARVLIIGGGTGLLLETVLTRSQPRQVVYLEASAQMISRTQKRVRAHWLAGRVVFQHGTEATLAGNSQFEVIITPFVLDLFSESELAGYFIPKLQRTLVPGGLWLATDFVNSPNRFHQLILRTMYLFFATVSGVRNQQLADWPRLLTQAGLIPGEQVAAVGGQVSTGWWTAS